MVSLPFCLVLCIMLMGSQMEVVIILKKNDGKL
jgi:hypothetical protein